MSLDFNSSHSNHFIIRQMERNVTSDEFLQKIFSCILIPLLHDFG